MAEQCLDERNERSTVIVTVGFIDEDGDPVTPDSATYRIDDEDNRRSILPATAIGSLADSVDITITSDQNYIIRPRSDYEIRTVTVEWLYDSSTKRGTAAYKYKLINLYGVVDVPSASVSPSASASPSV